MRIAHVTATFPPYHGGAGTVCYYNARELGALGHDVTVVTAAHGGESQETPPNFQVYRLPAVFRIGNAPFLPGLLRLRGYDIVHLHYPFIFGAEMIWLAARLKKFPYVLTYHNDLLASGVRGSLFTVYRMLFTGLIFRSAHKVAAVTLDHAHHSRVAALFDAMQSRVIEIPNGVDVDAFHPNIGAQPVRRKLGIPERARVILFVGALDQAHHYRRVDLLLEAFTRISTESELHLIIVGDGNRRAHYETLAQRLAGGTRVHFLGALSHHELPQIYAACDILALPSELQESFGIVLIEAMACGKPVVASNIPGARSVVSDGDDGLLVAPGSTGDLAIKLENLVNDPDKCREMGCKGRRKVEERFTWAKIGRDLERLYEEVIASAR